LPASAAPFAAVELSADAALLGQFRLLNLCGPAHEPSGTVAGGRSVGATALQSAGSAEPQGYGALAVFGSLAGPVSISGDGRSSAPTIDTGRVHSALSAIVAGPQAGTLADVFAPPSVANMRTGSFVGLPQNSGAGLANLPGSLLPSQPGFKRVTGSGNGSGFVVAIASEPGAMLPSLGDGPGDAYGRFRRDFVDASELRFAGTWNANILAPLADITAQGGRLSGSVVVASMTQSAALNQGNLFAGDLSGVGTLRFRRVPEPASLAVLAVGVGAAVWGRRRRK
jgi:hypothetical protein